MTWPQLVVLIVLLAACVRDVWAITTDRSHSAAFAAGAIFVFLAWRVTLALVLSAGGFW